MRTAFLNRRRAGLPVVLIIVIGIILVFSPAAEAKALSARLSVFCAAVLLLCSMAFVLSFRGSLSLFIAATSIIGVLLALKQIRFEHPEGGNVLRQVADSIKSCFRRETDIINRIGGDEFLIFLMDVNDNRVLEMAQYLSSFITNLKVTTASENNSHNFLSVSIGLCTMLKGPKETTLDDLARQAGINLTLDFVYGNSGTNKFRKHAS
jgi:diguanylate cyclase (GGDEF)-like protein